MDELFLQPEAKSAGVLYLATIGAVSTGGVTLIFDGQTAATAKEYRRLASYSPEPGDRVLAAKMSGTFVVLGKIE